MIVFEEIGDGEQWRGSDWSITDEGKLAVLIARVALGQHRHVLKILEETGCSGLAPTATVLDGAVKLLTVKSGESPYHRDGWLFQTIAWIAANIQDPDSLKSPPHMIHADKGFDGLHLCLDETNSSVVTVVLCEEKASEGPRGIVTSQVWPEFKTCHAGTRDNEIVSQTTTLLATNNHVDPERAVHEILWKKARAYRVSITIGDKERSESGRKMLFKGYRKTVPGDDVDRRRAETLYLGDLRQWMSDIAKKAVVAAKAIESENV